MWKIQDFSATPTLLEFNFGHFEAQKTAILTIRAAMNFEFLGNFNISSVNFFQRSKFKASKMIKMAIFDFLKSAKIDFS